MKKLNIFILLALVIQSVSFAGIQTKYKRLVVFGDSLSDVGTYSKTAGPHGGGKFTNNPGKIWIENVAADLNLSIKPNRFEGYGIPTQLAGGFNYAQGGARVTIEQPQSRNNDRPTSRPVATQVQYFLQQHRQFLPNDLVVIQGGANDLFAQIQLLKEGKVTPEGAIKNMVLAGNQLVEIVHKLRVANAHVIFVANLPMVQKTPFALSLNAQMQSLIEQMALAFNAQLITTERFSGVKILDIYGFETAMTNNYPKYGIKNITQPGCNLQVIPVPSSLYCTMKSLVEPGSERTFKYADTVHPSNIYYALVGKFAVTEILRHMR